MLSEKALLTSRAMRRVENTKVALDAFHDTFDSLVWGVINRGENHVIATWKDLGFAGDDPEACWDASKDHFINELIKRKSTMNTIQLSKNCLKPEKLITVCSVIKQPT